MVVVSDIAGIMDNMAPRRLAEDWDNVGLHYGDPENPVTTVMVALDPTLEACKAAKKAGAQVLITHHPLIFKPLARIDLNTHTGKVIDFIARNRIAVYCAHTNLDSVEGGVNDVLAEIIGIESLRPLAAHAGRENPGEGLGRIGELPGAKSLSVLARQIRSALGLSCVKIAGSSEMAVRTAALCSGGGSGLVGDFLSSSAQVYISGDLNHHAALDIAAAGKGLIDIGHFASERPVVPVLSRRIREACEKKGFAVEVIAWEDEPDPFLYIQ